MHLCCGRLTNRKKPKKTRETTRKLTSDETTSSGHGRNHCSNLYGEVKQSSLKEETCVASGSVQHLLRNSVSHEQDQSPASVLRDRGMLSSFGNVVPREMPSKKQELTDSLNSDYDNTTNSTESNNISSAVVRLPRDENPLKEPQGECDVIPNTTTSNSLSFPAETNLSLPVQTSKAPEADQANIDLDLVVALMNSMVTSDNSDHTIPARVQRSDLVAPRNDQLDALKPPEDLMSVRRHRNMPSSDPPNEISTENTSTNSNNRTLLFSQSSHLKAEASVNDQPHSAVFRVNSSSELRSDNAGGGGGAEHSRCLSRETDTSLIQVSASQMLPTATKAKGNSTMSGFDYYFIPEKAKDSDYSNLGKSPQRPDSASSLLSGISMHTETDASAATAQEATKRTSGNNTFSENLTEDSILTPRQSINSEPNCFASDMEECPSRLTSSRGKVVSVASSVSLASDVAGVSPVPTPADHFKALRLDVLKATSKLLDFVGEIWRKQETLHGKLFKINLLCLNLKTGLQALENFGIDLVSHLSGEERQMSEKNLFPQMKLLQNIRNGINRYLKSLEKETLSEHKELSEQCSDEKLKVKVGNIILLTKVIPGLVRTFGSFVDDIVKANLSSRNVVISGLNNYYPKAPPSEKNPTNFSPDLSTPGYLTHKSDIPNSPIEETPPAIPPKMFHAAKTTDSEMLRHNKHDFLGNGIDSVRAAVSCGTPSYNEGTNLTTVNLSNNDTKAKQANGERNNSFAGEALILQSKLTSHSCSDATDSLEEDVSRSSMVLRRQSPISPPESIAKDSNDAVNGLENRFSASELVTPDIRGSGISLTVQTKLEELQRQATSHNVLLHTDADCSFMDYDLPAGIMEENLPNLCESDCKLLLYYSDEMFNHWKVLDSAALAFFKCMENSQLPKVFIMHSKFVIVAGHKMAYIGDVLACNVMDSDARHWLLAYSNDLCDRLKQAVRKTKEAALTFPAVMPQQSMVDAIKDVTDSAYELRELLFRLAYLGKAEQTISW